MSKLFNSEDVLTPFNFEKSKDLLNKLCYFGSSKTELIANIVKDNKMLLSQKFDGGIDCYCAENNEWYSFCIPCYKVKTKEIKAEVKEEVKPKVDNDTLICFLRQHLDLDEDKTVIHYVNIEGRTVEIKLSELKWKYEEFYSLFDVKIKYRINRQGFLVLYLEDLREG